MHPTIPDELYERWAATYPGPADALERMASLHGEDGLALPPSGPWTVARVKDELPDVRVSGMWGSNIPATVRGRRLAMARVHFRIGGQPYSVEYAWNTIVTALNTGQPLRA
jgi:hypothetical protein